MSRFDKHLENQFRERRDYRADRKKRLPLKSSVKENMCRACLESGRLFTNLQLSEVLKISVNRVIKLREEVEADKAQRKEPPAK